MRKLNRKQWLLVFASVAAGLLVYSIPLRITIATTNSVKYKVFWTSSPDAEPLKRGMYVRSSKFIDLQSYESKQYSIIKKIGCMSGDRLDEKNGSYYCNGIFFCKSLTGRENFHFAGVIPDESVFLVGDSQTSYDSRYFGLARTGEIDALLEPIF
jgi:conjugal transfer pilin signal peptidase TrbI